MDYRDLNSVTEPINFPLPRLEHVIDSVGENSSKIFTVLNIMAGFHQVPVHEETKHKTSFVTHSGCYSFKRLPYGLNNAPIAFQCVMAQVLQGINFRYALVYIADILIHSSSLMSIWCTCSVFLTDWIMQTSSYNQRSVSLQQKGLSIWAITSLKWNRG